MRIAILADIHGNLTAFEAVLADLRLAAPDLVLHGGDLCDGGSGPAEIADRIREFGWQGVSGNTDEMLFAPESLRDFAKQTPAFQPLLTIVEEMAAATRETLGEDRMAWLRALPLAHVADGFALVHAGPASRWRAPSAAASDQELHSVYGPLGRSVAVYGHIHTPYLRTVEGLTVVNAGSVGLPYDGDRRASYLLLDDGTPQIRRVEYDVDREIQALHRARVPRPEWIAAMLTAAAPRMP